MTCWDKRLTYASYTTDPIGTTLSCLPGSSSEDQSDLSVLCESSAQGQDWPDQDQEGRVLAQNTS